ncbi:MAG: class I SAM-dependent methyltransferase, partial [Spirochaetota bacterium]|nr:class I SAM-dependent methyltransferase [Spirochaetota bacterium]
MLNIFKIKVFFFAPLIKWILKNPGLMESKLFLKAMLIFPKMISKTYDKKIAKSGPTYPKALELGLTQIPKSPERILDLCTGTGFSAFKAAEVFPSSSINAIDQIIEMLDIARKKANERGITNINFKTGNAANLDYDNAEFDLILTSNAPIYLSEAARVLKPEGLFLAVYSFSGDAFVTMQVHIAKYLNSSEITLLEVKSTGNGVYILGQKNR